MPITTENPSAPEFLLKTIFYRCTNDCGSDKCGYRKAMLNCSTACLQCLNGVPVDENDDEEKQDSLTIENKDDMVKKPLSGPLSPKATKYILRWSYLAPVT